MMSSRSLLALSTVAVAAVLCAAWRRRRQQKVKRAQEALPPAFVISLAARYPAKCKSALQRCSDAGLPAVELLEAVDARELSHDELARRGVTIYAAWKLESSTFRFFNRDLKWGEIGCGLSHVAAWSRVSSLSVPCAVILEDDVDFIPDFCSLLRHALVEAAALARAGVVDPDALYLCRKAMRPENDVLLPLSGEGVGGGGSDPAGESTAPGRKVRLVVPGFSYKTTAYVLWTSGARKLLASGYTGKLIPVDDFLALTYARHEAKVGEARPDLDALFQSAPRLNMLATRPQLCRERRGVSATENSPLISAPPR